jgi:hypothetical protein
MPRRLLVPGGCAGPPYAGVNPRLTYVPAWTERHTSTIFPDTGLIVRTASALDDEQASRFGPSSLRNRAKQELHRW